MASRHPNDHPRYRYPPNLAQWKGRIHSCSAMETNYLWREVIEEGQYYHPSLDTLPSEAVIVDVGANIGLFALWSSQLLGTNPIVHAIEANPTVADLCRRNASLVSSLVSSLSLSSTLAWTTHNLAISDREEETLPFRVYPHATGWSTCSVPFEAHEDALYRDLWRVVTNRIVGSWLFGGWFLWLWPVLSYLLKPWYYVAWRFLVRGAYTVNVPSRTVSSWMRRESIIGYPIDLLKIDVEKHEWNVLRGIRDDDWDRIRRVVLEVEVRHDDVRNLLESHGFRVESRTDPRLRGTPYRMMWAWKDPTGDRTE